MSNGTAPVPIIRQPRGPGSDGGRGFLARKQNDSEPSTATVQNVPQRTKKASKTKNPPKSAAKLTIESNKSDLHLAHNLADKERTEDVVTDDNRDKTFADMLLSQPVLAGLRNAGFHKPSPIQLAAIPRGKVGFDLIVQSKSGTGKTCVYVVTALEMIQVETAALQVLVIAPTREIATQGATVAMQIGAAIPDLKMSAFIGGISVQEDKVKLKKCQLAVGTPGRVKQLLTEGHMSSDNIRLVVLDEADKLLEPSFLADTTAILNRLPANKQVVALSATYPDQLARLAERFMRSPQHVRLGRECQVLAGVAQYVMEVEASPAAARQNSIKHTALLAVLSSVSYSQCLVFSNYQTIAQSTADYLNSRGFPSIFISAGQDQQRRLQAMATFKQFNCRILCSTDLTARGIDAQNVNLVINLDVPWDHNTYLHRIGRGGRFGSFSVAITLAATGGELTSLRKIVTKTGSAIKVLPEDIPKDLRVTKERDLAILEGVPVEEEDVTKPRFKHEEGKEEVGDSTTKTAEDKKSGKVKRRGKKRGKSSTNLDTEPDISNDKSETVQDNTPPVDNVPGQATEETNEDKVAAAHELLEKHLNVSRKPRSGEWPSYEEMQMLVKKTVAGESVDWSFSKREVKEDELEEDVQEQVGVAAELIINSRKQVMIEKQKKMVEKLKDANLNEIIEKLIAGEEIALESEDNLNKDDAVETTSNMVKQISKEASSESKDSSDSDDTSDSESSSSSSSSSSSDSDESSSESSSSDSDNGGPSNRQIPQMMANPAQMFGYHPHMPGYVSQVPLYRPQSPLHPAQVPGLQPGYGQHVPSYPQHVSQSSAWYQQWLASVRQQRAYVEYCEYWRTAGDKTKKK